MTCRNHTTISRLGITLGLATIGFIAFTPSTQHRTPVTETVRYEPGDGLGSLDLPVDRYLGKTSDTTIRLKDGTRVTTRTLPTTFISADGENRLQLLRTEDDGTLVTRRTTTEWVR